MNRIITIIFLVCLTNAFGKTSCDTITNWTLYKDKKPIWKSNYFASARPTIKINSSEKFKNLEFTIFYDFHREIIERKVELICEGKVIGTLNDKNYSYERFVIPRKEFVEEYKNKEIQIKYIDKIEPNGIIIGVVMFI